MSASCAPSGSCDAQTMSEGELPLLAEEDGDQTESSAAAGAQDDAFLQDISVDEGPLALYKENRLSGFYRRVGAPELLH